MKDMKTRLSAVLALCAAFMTGCSFTSDFSVVKDQTLPGFLLPVPLVDVPLVPGLSCNLPDEQTLDQAVEDAVGPFLAGVFAVKKAELLSLTVAAKEGSPGDFSTVTRLALSLFLLDTGGVRVDQVPLGEADAPGGFGAGFELPLDTPVDLVEILRSEADCGALALVAGGAYPTRDVVFDVSARVRIRIGLRR